MKQNTSVEGGVDFDGSIVLIEIGSSVGDLVERRDLVRGGSGSFEFPLELL